MGSSMIRLLSIAAIALPLVAVSAGPSFATKGIDAARACDKNPRCTLLLDDAGGATILIGDTIIDCPGPQQECTVVSRTTIKGGLTPANRGTVFAGSN